MFDHTVNKSHEKVSRGECWTSKLINSNQRHARRSKPLSQVAPETRLLDTADFFPATDAGGSWANTLIFSVLKTHAGLNQQSLKYHDTIKPRFHILKL